jgi:hypothetical protein
MRARWFPCGALLGLLVLPITLRAGEAKSEPPMLVLRVRSIDTVIDNGKLLARLAGKEELGNQVEGLIKLRLGPNGLEGIDTRRPIGVYANVSDDLSEPAGVVMVPIADEKAFLGLLENLNFKAEKKKDGLYVIQQELIPLPIGFRFAHKYAYFTVQNLRAIAADSLVAPARIFPRSLTADFSGSLRLDRIPSGAKKLALGKIEEDLAKEKDKRKKGETEAQHKARLAILDTFARDVAKVLDDGRELTGQLSLDRQGEALAVQLALDATPGSRLANDLRALGEHKSLFAGLLAKGAAVNGLFHVVLPEEVRKALTPVVEEGMKQAEQNEPNDAKRQAIARLNKALTPSLKAGDVDAAFSLRGPSAAKLYTLVAAVKLHKGDVLEQTLRDLLKALPAEERAKIHLDEETVRGAKVHRIDAQKTFDPKARAAFGDNPVYVSFRTDAVLLAVGDKGLDALKEALASEPAAAPPLLIEVAVGQLARALAQTDEQREAVRKVFTKEDEGAMRLEVTGGATLQLRFTSRLSVFRFAALSYQLGKAPAQDDSN